MYIFAFCLVGIGVSDKALAGWFPLGFIEDQLLLELSCTVYNVVYTTGCL